MRFLLALGPAHLDGPEGYPAPDLAAAAGARLLVHRRRRQEAQGEALRAEPEVLQSSGVALRVDVGVRSVIGVGVLDRKALRRAASRAAGAPLVPEKRNLQSPAVQ